MDKISLLEYQRKLSARLVNLEGGQRVSKLGVQAGAGAWLIDLADAGEVIPVPPVSRVPLTRPWFAGLVNVRGILYTVVDFSLFLGGAPTVLGDRSRLMLIGEQHRVNCGLLIDRVHGLYRNEQLSPARGTAHAAWSSGSFDDAQGNAWQQLDVSGLVAHADFLNVGA